MSRDPTLLDTNVLIDALYKDSDHYPAARALLDQAKQEDADFCTTPQVLAEFYAVVTHPRRVTHPKLPEEALSAIGAFLAMPGMSLLLIPPDIVSRWMELVRRYPQHVTNRKTFRCATRGHNART
jgi:predicted nucleic acid-binding protein